MKTQINTNRAFFAIALAAVLVSCGGNGTGTDVGNPAQPVFDQIPSDQLITAVCEKLKECYPASSNCSAGIRTVNGLPTRFGAISYATMNDLSTGERTGEVVAETTPLATCKSSIAALSCTDPNVIAAYNPASVTPFAGVSNMIPTNPLGCASVY